MKGVGRGIHIPVEAEVCTDQAHQAPAIAVLLHHAGGASLLPSDYNILLPVASVEPKRIKGCQQMSNTKRTNGKDLGNFFIYQGRKSHFLL